MLTAVILRDEATGFMLEFTEVGSGSPSPVWDLTLTFGALVTENFGNLTFRSVDIGPFGELTKLGTCKYLLS